MKYENIERHIRRYSFDSKMGMSFLRSRVLYPLMIRRDPTVFQRVELPDRLETFAMFSIYSGEWNGHLYNIDGHEYIRIINAIHNVEPPGLETDDNSLFTERVFPSIGANQYWWQESSFSHYYRYYCYFTAKTNSLDMREEFRKFFGVDYTRMLKFAFNYRSLIYLDKKKFQSNKSVTSFLNNTFFNYYRDAAKPLLKTRGDETLLIKEHINNIYDLASCLRPFTSYPFVEYGEKVYCPVVYAVRPAASDSLMFRLLLDKPNIKNVIHEVYEKYLFDIAKNSLQFDEVFPEYTYKEEMKTVDVMARKGDKYLLLDSKSFTPKADLRIYNDEARKSGELKN